MNVLTQQQIERLVSQGCSAEPWDAVSIDPAADLGRIRGVEFRGKVSVGPNDGTITVEGVKRACGIYNAALTDVSVGRGVRIAAVGSVISRYDIGDAVAIEDVASLIADEDSAFGVGTSVETVNEAGGRNVTLHPDMTAQTAYLQAFRLHDPKLQEGLKKLLSEGKTVKVSRGKVGEGSRVVHCGTVRNVNIGPYASVEGAALLVDGTILSCAEHPTVVGAEVQAKHFIVAEGARIDSGVLLEKVYVGQATKLGKQFSAENSLFFANCEGFHGEAVAVFGGPYTVTHHKSTLLIAAQFSFYNAGSGTNQSNHMYKLGPVHQGVFERGSKTGSFSYVLHETHVGPFSVVIGKHYTNIDTPDLPFSYIHESEGQSQIVPGMNLFSVGTVRDGEKWPKRDGRKGPLKRDLITFDVFSPYTVESMRRGRDMLQRLQESTPKEKSAIQVGGVVMKRLLLKKSVRFYAQAVTRYVNGRVLKRLEEALSGGKGWGTAVASLTPTSRLARPREWVDVAGLLLPREILIGIEQKVSAGAYATLEDLRKALSDAASRYAEHEWEYIASAVKEDSGVDLGALSAEKALELLTAYGEATLSLQNRILDDSKREYDAFARISFGAGMSDEEAARDFEAVRGSAETNGVVRKLVKEKEEITAWVEGMMKKLGRE